MVKKNKKIKKNKYAKKPEAKMPEAKMPEEQPVRQPSISIKDLNTIGIAMMSNGLVIDSMNQQEQRIQLMNESWEFTQLLIKQQIRQTRKEVNDKLVEFFNTFPEALDPIKQQFISSSLELEEE